MLGPRSTSREIMDDMSINDERIDAALAELSVINRLLGGDRVSTSGIRRATEAIPIDRPLQILDCGAGGSDLVHALRELGRPFHVTALDLNFRACQSSRPRISPMSVVNASALRLPFCDRSFDIVHAALFCHHFTEPELDGLFAEWSRVARVGIVINDLRRSVWAFLGITLLTSLFSRSSMVRHDGPLSVRRGFLKKELSEIASRHGSVTITRHWAFRWLVSISFPEDRHGRKQV
ncbi:MAG: methyltransferase domain-containing protein [Ignavibacteriales bacterium]|nr:methyltransferase domain-containing protein [Ignavibacteriales bacterium]